MLASVILPSPRRFLKWARCSFWTGECRTFRSLGEARLVDKRGSVWLNRRPPGTAGLASVEYPSGQRGQTVNLLAYAFAGSNPASTTTFPPLGERGFREKQLLFFIPDQLNASSSRPIRDRRGLEARGRCGPPERMNSSKKLAGLAEGDALLGDFRELARAWGCPVFAPVLSEACPGWRPYATSFRGFLAGYRSGPLTRHRGALDPRGVRSGWPAGCPGNPGPGRQGAPPRARPGDGGGQPSGSAYPMASLLRDASVCGTSGSSSVICARWSAGAGRRAGIRLSMESSWLYTLCP